jgi:hypothetical protein
MQITQLFGLLTILNGFISGLVLKCWVPLFRNYSLAISVIVYKQISLSNKTNESRPFNYYLFTPSTYNQGHGFIGRNHTKRIKSKRIKTSSIYNSGWFWPHTMEVVNKYKDQILLFMKRWGRPMLLTRVPN